jgi:hypothetical protein
MFFITNVHYMIPSLIFEMGLENFIGGVSKEPFLKLPNI